MEKLDLVKVQSRSALQRGNVSSALLSHLLSSYSVASHVSPQTICRELTVRYEAGRESVPSL